MVKSRRSDLVGISTVDEQENVVDCCQNAAWSHYRAVYRTANKTRTEASGASAFNFDYKDNGE